MTCTRGRSREAKRGLFYTYESRVKFNRPISGCYNMVFKTVILMKSEYYDQHNNNDN